MIGNKHSSLKLESYKGNKVFSSVVNTAPDIKNIFSAFLSLNTLIEFYKK
jgi:hypothetical protein